MKLPRRAVHLDFHTMPAVPDVGAEFDAETFARTLEDARVDFITVVAKCNLGMAYYPTKVGVMHPSLKRDLLGEMVEACHGRGIAVAVYWNAGLDHEMALRHRDWTILGDDGRTYREDHHKSRRRLDKQHAGHVEDRGVTCDDKIDGLQPSPVREPLAGRPREERTACAAPPRLTVRIDIARPWYRSSQHADGEPRPTWHAFGGQPNRPQHRREWIGIPHLVKAPPVP